MVNLPFGPPVVNRNHPLNRGRVAWYLATPANSGGAKWLDLMGLYHGTLTNMTTSASGWRGTTRPGGRGHLLFDGSDDRVSIPLIPLSGSALTYSAWFTWGGGTQETLISHAKVLLGYYFGALTYYSNTSLGNVSQSVSLTAGAWHHAAVAQSGTAYTLYLDGLPIKSGTTNAINTASENQTLGSYGTIWFLHGGLDDVRIYPDRALTDAEVWSLYDFSRCGYLGVLNRTDPATMAFAPAGTIVPQAMYHYRRRRVG